MEASYGAPEATARALIYSFLRQVFTPLSPSLIKDLRELLPKVDVSVQVLSKLGYLIDDDFRGLVRHIPLSGEELAKCRRVYAAIFLSRVPSLLRESSFVKGLNKKELEKMYAEIGIVYQEPGLESDHLLIELDFMHHLTLAEALSWRRGNPLRVLALECEFLEKHLAAWAPNVGRIVQEESRNAFYEKAGTLLYKFLLRDIQVAKLVFKTLKGLF